MKILKQLLSGIGYFLFDQGTYFKRISPTYLKRAEKSWGDLSSNMANLTTMFKV